MEQIKIMIAVIGIAIAIAGMFTGIIVATTYFSNKNDDQRFARTIQCKEIGGQMTYENYTWICK